MIDIFRLLLKREGFTQSEINKINQAVKFHEREIIKANKGDSVVGDASISYKKSKEETTATITGLKNGSESYKVIIYTKFGGGRGVSIKILRPQAKPGLKGTYYLNVPNALKALKGEHNFTSSGISQFKIGILKALQNWPGLK